MIDPAATRDGAVVVAYVHSRDVTYSWHHSMVELIGWDLTHDARILRGGYVSMKCATDGLSDARNKAVKLFLEEDRADWLFWIDTDMGFAPDTLDRLMEAADPVERPVVGGLAFTQREEAPDGMGGWRCLATPTVFDWTALDDGQMGFNVRWNYPPDTLTRCAGTGSACVLIHRSVFERVEAEYGPIWYDRIFNSTMGKLTSEDLSLCMRAGALGIPVHVHTGVKTTHQKVLWLQQDDYFAQVAQSRIPPQVQPAVEQTAVIVPVLGRPQNAAPFMASLRASTGLATVYAVAERRGVDDETAEAWRQAGAEVLRGDDEWLGGTATADANPPPAHTFAEKVNLGYRQSREPWLFLVGDDVRFESGWLDQAQAAARDGAHVIGTNDLHNPLVLAGEHATHLLIRRAYIDERGASWDGPGIVCHEGYRHNFVDDEIVTVAKQRGVWAMARHARVEHLHPMWGTGVHDATYQLGQAAFDDDRTRFEKRQADHA